MGGNPSALAILTRPQGRNDALAARLERHGMGALVLPALQLIPGEVGAMPSPDGFDLVLFVSGYAAQCYFQAQAVAAWPAGTLAAAVGASTLQAIAHWGKVPAAALFGPPDDSLQDSEALWQSLQDAGIRPQRVLIVRGSTGRDWLGQRLQQDGAQVTWLATYRRDPAVWTASQGRALADAVRQHAASLLLVSSADSARAIDANLRRLALTDLWASMGVLAVHPRIAECVQALRRACGIADGPDILLARPDETALFQTMMAHATPS